MTCKIKIALYALVLLLVASCSNTRFLPEGELLYTGGTVKVKDSSMSKKQRKALRKELAALKAEKSA